MTALAYAPPADRGLQVRPLQRLAEQPAEFSIHANVRIRFDESRNVLEVTTERKGQIDYGADSFD